MLQQGGEWAAWDYARKSAVKHSRTDRRGSVKCVCVLQGGGVYRVTHPRVSAHVCRDTDSAMCTHMYAHRCVCVCTVH